MGTYDQNALVSFKLKAGTLAAALARLSGVADERLDGHGVGHVFMEGRPEGVFCTVGCSTHTLTVPVLESEGAGVLLPHLTRLRGYTAACGKSDEVGLGVEGDFVRVRIGNGKAGARVRSIKLADYEKVSLDFVPELTIRLSVKDLARAFDGASRVISGDDKARPWMMGAWLEVTEMECRVVGSDGHRLNLNRVRMEGASAGDNWRGVIMGRHIKAVQGVLGDHGEETIEVHLGKNRIRFASPMGDLTLIPGDPKFPNYLALVSPLAAAKWKATVSRDDLLSAVKRVSAAGDQHWIIEVNLDGNAMRVCAMPGKGSGTEVNEAMEEVQASSAIGDLTLRANLSYLSTAIDLQPPGEITIYCTGQEMPIFILAEMAPGAVHIVMPRR